MFEKVEVPVLGIVENMRCIFAVTVVTMSRFSVPVVQKTGREIPHAAAGADAVTHLLREDLDKGTPTVISRPESEFTLSTASWLTALQLSSTGRVKYSWRDFLPRGLTRINHSGYSHTPQRCYIDAVYLFLQH